MTNKKEKVTERTDLQTRLKSLISFMRSSDRDHAQSLNIRNILRRKNHLIDKTKLHDKTWADPKYKGPWYWGSETLRGLNHTFWSVFMGYLAKEIVEAKLASPAERADKTSPDSFVLDKILGHESKKDPRSFGTSLPLLPDIRSIKVTLGPWDTVAALLGITVRQWHKLEIEKLKRNSKANRFLIHSYIRMIKASGGILPRQVVSSKGFGPRGQVLMTANSIKEDAEAAAKGEGKGRYLGHIEWPWNPEKREGKSAPRDYNPKLFWSIADNLMRRSTPFLTASMRRLDVNWEGKWHISTLEKIFADYYKIVFTRWNYMEKARFWIQSPPGRLRPLTIPTVPWRLYAAQMALFMDIWIRKTLPPTQHAYTYGRGTMTAWRQILRDLIIKNKNHSIFDFDLKKFFSTINLDKLAHRLSLIDTPKWVVGHLMTQIRDPAKEKIQQGDLIKDYVHHTPPIKKTWLDRLADPSSKVETIGWGVSMGTAYSPLMAIFALNDWYWWLLGKKANLYMYADDGLVTAPPEVDLRQLVKESEEFLKNWGVRINWDKSGFTRRGTKWLRPLKFLGLVYDPYADTLSSRTRSGKELTLEKGLVYGRARGSWYDLTWKLVVWSPRVLLLILTILAVVSGYFLCVYLGSILAFFLNAVLWTPIFWLTGRMMVTDSERDEKEPDRDIFFSWTLPNSYHTAPHKFQKLENIGVILSWPTTTIWFLAISMIEWMNMENNDKVFFIGIAYLFYLILLWVLSTNWPWEWFGTRVNWRNTVNTGFWGFYMSRLYNGDWNLKILQDWSIKARPGSLRTLILETVPEEWREQLMRGANLDFANTTSYTAFWCMTFVWELRNHLLKKGLGVGKKSLKSLNWRDLTLLGPTHSKDKLSPTRRLLVKPFKFKRMNTWENRLSRDLADEYYWRLSVEVSKIKGVADKLDLHYKTVLHYWIEWQKRHTKFLRFPNECLGNFEFLETNRSYFWQKSAQKLGMGRKSKEILNKESGSLDVNTIFTTHPIIHVAMMMDQFETERVRTEKKKGILKRKFIDLIDWAYDVYFDDTFDWPGCQYEDIVDPDFRKNFGVAVRNHEKYQVRDTLVTEEYFNKNKNKMNPELRKVERLLERRPQFLKDLILKQNFDYDFFGGEKP